MEILIDIHKNGAYSNKAIERHLNKSMSSQDENLIRELVYGVLENKIYIDYIISKASKIRIKKIHFQIIEILRTGIYQIVFMDRIPHSAAVNEAVNLAKKYGHKGTIGYVNGILRAIVRDKETFTKIDNKDRDETFTPEKSFYIKTNLSDYSSQKVKVYFYSKREERKKVDRIIFEQYYLYLKEKSDGD